MRKDMNKKLHDMLRGGSETKFGDVRKSRKCEDLGGREGMRFRYKMSYNNKYKSFNFVLIKRFLAANVGQQWNKVYSEFCQGIDYRSNANAEARDYLLEYVERHCTIEDGEIVYPTIAYQRSDGYYVHPKTGLLLKNEDTLKDLLKKRKEDRIREERKSFRQLDENTVLRKIDGNWFEFEIDKIPVANFTIQRPFRKNSFTITHFWGTTETKTWDDLNEHERCRFGTMRPDTSGVYDCFFNELCLVDKVGHRYTNAIGELVKEWMRGNPKFDNKYHVTKKTASRATLKKAGLI